MKVLVEFRRRNVDRAALFYAGLAWLLVQVATQVFPFFDVPNWAVRVVVIAAIIGFPFALLFAWFYEWTPDGIRRESDVDRSDSIVRATGRKLDRWIIAILALAVVLLLTDRFVLRKDARAAGEKSIAVMPLVNESGDPDNEYFSDGLSEELIAALARVEGLKVIGRSSSFRFKGKTDDHRAIGAALGVATLVEGTVRRQANRVRIVVGLISTDDGHQLWAQTYDRQLEDIFAVQADIARALAQSLQVELLGGDPKPTAAASTASVEAHNTYLKGHEQFERRSIDGWSQAIAHFDEAIRLDPDYALAWAERAETRSWLADQTGEDMAARRLAARSDAEMAVALAPALAEARTALGWIRLFDERNLAAAITELRLAEQLAPGSSKVKSILAQLLGTLGQTDAAIAHARRAVELDPLYPYAHSILARNLLAANRFDEAAAEGRRMAELQPGAGSSHVNQVKAAVLQGDGETALREANLEPSPSYRRFLLALAQSARGDHAAADAALAELVARDSSHGLYQIALVHAFRGEKDAAFDWLQRAYDAHDTGLLSLSGDPLLRDLRSDPRFAALLSKMGIDAPAPR